MWWLADEETRAAKALKDLIVAHNACRTQATAGKVAKHAQNFAEWELKYLALPPGT